MMSGDADGYIVAQIFYDVFKVWVHSPSKMLIAACLHADTTPVCDLSVWACTMLCVHLEMSAPRLTNTMKERHIYAGNFPASAGQVQDRGACMMPYMRACSA